MAPTLAAELPTLDFGRWAARSRLVFPIPLNAGYAAQVELPWEELLEVSDDRIDVTNARAGATAAAASAERAARDLEPRVRELLPFASGLLSGPEYAVFAGRSETGTGRSTLVVGFGRGADGLVVVDNQDTVRLVKSAASELAATVAAALPPTAAGRLTPVDVGTRTLTGLQTYGQGRAADQRTRDRLTAQGVPHATAELLNKLAAQGTATGIIGAVAYGATEPRVSERDAMWVEGRSGAVLKRTLADERYRFESATRGAVTAALIAALDDVRGAGKGRR